MSEILRDIEKELKRERWLSLWATYRTQILFGASALVLAIVLVGGFYLYNREKTQAASSAFDVALILKGKDGIAAFKALAQEGGVYGALASFHQATLLAEQGKRRKAAAIYDRLSGNSSLTPALQDLARIYSAQTLLRLVPYKEIEEKLSPAISTNRDLRYSALEILALAAFIDGKAEQARNLFQPLVENKNVPPTLAARAQIMLGKLDSQKEQAGKTEQKK
jgi:hypothetical protein